MVPPRSFADDYDFLSPVSSTRKLLLDISARLDFPTLSLALPPSSSSRQTHFTLLFLGSESGATLRYCANIDASPDGNGIVEGKVERGGTRERHRRGRPVSSVTLLFFRLHRISDQNIPSYWLFRREQRNNFVRGKETLAALGCCLLFSPKAKPPLCEVKLPASYDKPKWRLICYPVIVRPSLEKTLLP